MLNLITDSWIPVVTDDAQKRVIRPDQITEPGVARFDWVRPDFNIASCELLIGMIYLASPPRNTSEWVKGRKPDSNGIRERLQKIAAAFELAGSEFRFLQDLEDLKADSSPVDMLFIDSAGSSTAKKNADLFVKRDRYDGLSLSLAAIALYTFQSQAPAGGAGNRTSMRGGGPLITLVEPHEKSDRPLWDLIWANVPDGVPVEVDKLNEALPWMRPTVTSEKGQVVHPDAIHRFPYETFFGMPRRLRLDFSDGQNPIVTGVRQRPRGTNYGHWQHPLTPYYQQKEGAELLPMHPRAGANTYRNWEGISLGRSGGLRHVANCVNRWRTRSSALANLLVAGWSMDNMTPQDIVYANQPVFPLSDDVEDFAVSLVDAADAFSLALSGAMQSFTNTSGLGASQVEACREDFYTRTQQQFEDHVMRVSQGSCVEDIARSWCKVTQSVAMMIFESYALPGLHKRSIDDVEKIVKAHGQLRATFSGYGQKTGKKAFEALSLALPKKSGKKE